MKLNEKPEEIPLGLVAQGFWKRMMCYAINVEVHISYYFKQGYRSA
jgi:hypothetical protein